MMFTADIDAVHGQVASSYPSFCRRSQAKDEISTICSEKLNSISRSRQEQTVGSSPKIENFSEKQNAGDDGLKFLVRP